MFPAELLNGHRLAELRRKMCATARAIADTEDRVARTLERLAVNRPAEAARLRSRAAQAREFAAVERQRADTYAAGSASEDLLAQVAQRVGQQP